MVLTTLGAAYEYATPKPNLLAFMMEFSQEMDLETRELANCKCYVVCRMFQKRSGRRIKRILEIIQ